MPMQVKIDINGRNIVEATARNMGHPETGDHPHEDDLRLYQIVSRGETFEIEHNRADGAEVLASKIFLEIQSRKPRYIP